MAAASGSVLTLVIANKASAKAFSARLTHNLNRSFVRAVLKRLQLN